MGPYRPRQYVANPATGSIYNPCCALAEVAPLMQAHGPTGDIHLGEVDAVRCGDYSIGFPYQPAELAVWLGLSFPTNMSQVTGLHLPSVNVVIGDFLLLQIHGLLCLRPEVGTYTLRHLQRTM